MAYLEGDGVAKDYEQAFYWLDLACKLGSDKAESLLQDMRSMSLGTPFDGEATELKDNDSVAEGIGDRNGEGATTDIDIAAIKYALRTANYLANSNRCIACGMEALVPSARIAGAKTCSPDKGGCGTTLMIPIVENGLDRGLAMQPYRERSADRKGSTYSSLGALIHMVKYDARADDALKADMLAEIAGRIRECGVIEQLVGGVRNDLVIVPTPSSKRRKVQPVHLLARLISEGRYCYDNVLTKRSSVESKSRSSGAELAPGDIHCVGSVNGRVILLIDDTYGEGATLRACIRDLRENGAKEVYYLSLCKNIFGGMKGSSNGDNDIY